MKPITNGYNNNLFQKVTVSSATFQEDSDVTINFKNQQSFSLINEGSGVVSYSFNGNNLAGELKPGTPSVALFFNNRRISAIWFRLDSGAASVIRVEAWAGL